MISEIVNRQFSETDLVQPKPEVCPTAKILDLEEGILKVSYLIIDGKDDHEDGSNVVKLREYETKIAFLII